MVCKNTERGIRVGNICYNVTIDVVDDGAEPAVVAFEYARLFEKHLNETCIFIAPYAPHLLPHAISGLNGLAPLVSSHGCWEQVLFALNNATSC